MEGVAGSRRGDLEALPSSSEWSFPPKPETHHVRWIACHPSKPGRLWVAIEAGALISTADGGRSWRDRVEGGPWDTHELAIHPEAPATLRVSAGDGYFESPDGGLSWRSPREGLDVGYLRSVVIDPGRADVVLVSASSRLRTANVSGRSDGRLYRRVGGGRWERVLHGWPEPPDTNLRGLAYAGWGRGRGRKALRPASAPFIHAKAFHPWMRKRAIDRLPPTPLPICPPGTPSPDASTTGQRSVRPDFAAKTPRRHAGTPAHPGRGIRSSRLATRSRLRTRAGG